MTFPAVDGIVRGRIDGGGGNYRIELGTTQVSLDHNIPQQFFTEYNLDISQSSVSFHALANKLIFNVDNITFDAAGDSGRWKAQCLIGGVVEWERNINPGETSVTLAVEIDVTGYAGTTQDIVFRLKSTLQEDPAALNASVLTIQGTGTITVDAVDYDPVTVGQTHLVLVSRQGDGTLNWVTHFRQQGAAANLRLNLRSVAPKVDSQGNVYMSYQAADTSSPSGAGDMVIDVIPSAGPPTTVTCRAWTSAVGQYVEDAFLFRINADGTVAWVSRIHDGTDTTTTGGLRFIGLMELLDDDSLAVTFSNRHWGNQTAGAYSASFMPDTDGTKSLSYNVMQSFFGIINTADGKLTATPERLSADSWNLGHGSWYVNQHAEGGHGGAIAISDTGKAAAQAFTNHNAAADVEYRYRGHVAPMNTARGSLPAPTPPSQRFYRASLSTVEVQNMVFDSWTGDLRWEAHSGGGDQEPRGAASIPGTEDFVFADYTVLSGSGSWLFRQTSTDRATRTQGPGGNARGRFGGSVFRVNDNPGTPIDPNLKWWSNYYVTGGTSASYNQLRGSIIVMADDNLVIFGGLTDAGTQTIHTRDDSDGFVSTQAVTSFNATNVHTPTFYNSFCAALRLDNGHPVWVQTFQSTYAAVLLGQQHRRGREILIPFSWTDEVTMAAGTAEALNIVDPGATRAGFARLDITTGLFKGYVEEISYPASTSSLSYSWRRSQVGAAQIDGDLASRLAVVDTPMSTDPPAVVNAIGVQSFSTESALSGWQSLNTADGVISGTPLIGDVGVHGDVVKVTDQNGDFSYANSRSIYVEPNPDRRWRFDDGAGPTAVEEYISANGTYGAGALVNQSGQLGGSFRAQNTTSGGVVLPTLNLGPDFTFSMWMSPAVWSASDVNGFLFDFRTGVGSANYAVTALHISGAQPGAVRFSVYSAVGALLGSVTTPNLYFTNSGWFKWSFWVDGLTVGMSRGSTVWTGALSAPAPAGNRTNCAIGQYHTGSSGFAIDSYIDHAELWLSHAVNSNALVLASGIESGGTPAFP